MEMEKNLDSELILVGWDVFILFTSDTSDKVCFHFLWITYFGDSNSMPCFCSGWTLGLNIKKMPYLIESFSVPDPIQLGSVGKSNPTGTLKKDP